MTPNLPLRLVGVTPAAKGAAAAGGVRGETTPYTPTDVGLVGEAAVRVGRGEEETDPTTTGETGSSAGDVEVQGDEDTPTFPMEIRVGATGEATWGGRDEEDASPMSTKPPGPNC